MPKWLLPSVLSLLVAFGSIGCAAESKKINIDPQADASLRRMSQTLAAAKSFQVHSMATMEDRTDTGQMAQFSRDAIITIQRPDGFKAETRRGPDVRRIWHKGKELTILDVRTSQYAVLQTPEKIEEMLDFLAEKHGIVVALDDLMFPDPYRGLVKNVKTGVMVDQADVSDHKCDHLLFTQDNVDWQIWIDVEKQALPRKVVITYKEDPDRPQFEAVLQEWQLNISTEPSQFVPQLPPGAKKVDIEDLGSADEGEQK